MGLIYECCKNCPKRGNVCVCDAPIFSRLVEETSPTLEPIRYGPVIIEPQELTEIIIKKKEEDAQLKKELELYKKALELAVLEGHSKRTFKKRYYRFINQAKEDKKTK